MTARRRKVEIFMVEPEIAPAVREIIAVLRRNLSSQRRPPTRNRASTHELRRHGNCWRLVYGDTSFLFPDRVGFSYLITLLRQPGVPVAVTDIDRKSLSRMSSRLTGLADAVADETALAQARTRLKEVEEELDAAEGLGEPERYALLLEDRLALKSYVRSSEGLGARPRQFVDERERCRNRVCGAIRRAMTDIHRACPEAGEPLRRSVRLGRSCVYEPVAEVRWKL